MASSTNRIAQPLPEAFRPISLSTKTLECAICLNALKQKEDPVFHLEKDGDKHPFHKRCIEPWVTRRHSCPVCRLDLSTYFPKRLARGGAGFPLSGQEGLTQVMDAVTLARLLGRTPLRNPYLESLRTHPERFRVRIQGFILPTAPNAPREEPSSISE
jgi:hypothetical protein